MTSKMPNLWINKQCATIWSSFLQSSLEYFKSLRKIQTFPYYCPMGARAYAGNTCDWRLGIRTANQQALRPSMPYVHRDPGQEKRQRGKTFSLLSRGMLSLFSAHQSLNASTGHNMRPLEMQYTSSSPRKR